MPEDVLLNVAQVRTRLNCSRSHVYNLVAHGVLRGVKVGELRGLRISSISLDKYIKRKERDQAA